MIQEPYHDVFIMTIGSPHRRLLIRRLNWIYCGNKLLSLRRKRSFNLIFCCLLACLMGFGYANAQQVTVKGTIKGEDGNEMSGVSINEKGSTNGVMSDGSGAFTLQTLQNAVLSFSFVGYPMQEVVLATKKPGKDGIYHLDVVMQRDTASKLSDVVLVGYGTQKKSTLISSVTTVNPREIKGPTSNLTTMLAGRVSGMISFQRSGEPGKDNASFFIRGVGTFGAGKVDPLILIDGIESSPTDLARLQPDDIEGFSVLKDATATSVYGARGANGVILISTKVGQISKMKFNVRVEKSNSSNIENVDLADNISFMEMANESVLTRNPLGKLPYAKSKIDHTANGDDPLLYPNNDWIDLLTKNSTGTFRSNINASGGVEKAKYYLAMTYTKDNGNLKNNSLNGFNNNIKLQAYSILSNISLKLTSTTQALISLKGLFDDYNGPIDGGEAVYNSALWSNPVAFPAVYPAELMPYAKHPLFGNAIMPGSVNTLYSNPYARSLSGFQSYNSSTMTAQLSLKQDLKMLTPGLSARAMAYTTRYAHFAVHRQVSPYYYSPIATDGVLKGVYLINDGSAGNNFPAPTEYLTYSPESNTVNTTIYAEAAINYSRVFNEKHSVGGMLIGTLRNYLTGNAENLQLSLPSRNEGISGRFTYGYDNRYLIEYDFGYNGSERFAAKNRFGFFPSVGGGWVVSNEKFFKPLLNSINNLKFRFTYGLVGNDQIGNLNDRFFYLSQVGLDGGSVGSFGTNFSYSRPTVYINRYENDNITWERSRQTNIGMDLTFLHDFKLTVDAYKQHRYDILMVRSTIPTTMGLQAAISANTAEASSKGIDLALSYDKTFNKNLWFSARGNFTYATSNVLVNEEPDYSAADANLSRVGHSMNQIYGLIAERLFTDDIEVANSPTQFGNVLAGDIKYRDINGDGKISSEDYVPIGLPTVPEIVYGFGFSMGYKQFELSAFFVGNARTSFQIDPASITPFANQNGLLQVVADDHWSENDRNPYAFWPRLNSIFSENNDMSSSWWLRNGAFMRLKSAEVAYNFSVKMLNKVGLTSCRLYLNGINLLSFSSFKLWDPEMGASGLGYPIQKVVNVGVQLGF